MCAQDYEAHLQAQLSKAKNRFNAIQTEANEELPAGLAGFEEAKKVRPPHSPMMVCSLLIFRFAGSRE